MGAVLSCFIPGLGYVYHGRVLRGLLWLIVVVCSYPFFFPVTGLVLHLICVAASAQLDSQAKNDKYYYR